MVKVFSINDGYAEDGVHHGLYNGNGMNGGGQQVYISREAVVWGEKLVACSIVFPCFPLSFYITSSIDLITSL